MRHEVTATDYRPMVRQRAFLIRINFRTKPESKLFLIGVKIVSLVRALLWARLVSGRGGFP